MAPLDREECARWMRQADHTLASAERDLAGGDWGWSAFKAQQAAEYALKALLRGLGEMAPGHSVLRLTETLDATGALGEAARELDRHYIPPRYPDAYPAGSPFEFYDARIAGRALRAAASVVEWARREIERLEAQAGGQS